MFIDQHGMCNELYASFTTLSDLPDNLNDRSIGGADKPNEVE